MVQRLSVVTCSLYLADIIHEPGPYVSLSEPTTATVTTTTETHSQTVDIYLANHAERLPGLFLPPGWIASIPVTEPVTYGQVRELINSSNTELKVGGFHCI